MGCRTHVSKSFEYPTQRHVYLGMTKKLSTMRIMGISMVLALAGSSVGCMTTYDSQGRPVQSVDPGLAVAGVAAAGLIGYAAANNNDDRHYHHHYRGYRRPHRGYYRGYYR